MSDFVWCNSIGESGLCFHDLAVEPVGTLDSRQLARAFREPPSLVSALKSYISDDTALCNQEHVCSTARASEPYM
jgi:hypothetical protein